MNSPSWWKNRDHSSWERAKEALRRDWDQTKHDLNIGGHELNQKLADTVAQAKGQEVMPPIDEANPPKVIGRWEDIELPIEYGFVARRFLGEQYPTWNDELERRLKADWKAEQPWSAIRHYVRHGYELRS